MTDETEAPASSESKPAGKAKTDRDARLAARLRENLRKRKDQARQRDQGE